MASHPDPIIVPPGSGNHKQTFILLHGRGDNGEAFAAYLLRTSIPDFTDLQSAFPDAKFIFPTASKRRAAALNGQAVNQYFDLWTLTDPDDRDEMQLDGLRESSADIHALLRVAVDDVGAENVVLWGLSQGCATALISLLLWKGPPVAAAVGMCGWLPLRRRMLQRISTTVGAERSTDDAVGNLQAAVSCLGEALKSPVDIQDRQFAARETPVFLGHGVLDPKVSVVLGRDAYSFLTSVGLHVQWSDYQDLGHWYSGPMLRDIILFLRSKLGKATAQQ